jgi:hypothetical protein
MRTVTVIAILTVVLVGCASPVDSASEASTTTEPTTTTSTTTTTTLPPEPVLVFTVETSGGCLQAGPNCAAYQFFSDGTVELLRLGVDTTTPEGTGTIDPEFVTAVSEELMAVVSLGDLHASLPPGECRGCYDGIDTTFIYNVPDQLNTFESVDVELLDAIPLFRATWAALAEAELTLGQLEPEMRTG